MTRVTRSPIYPLSGAEYTLPGGPVVDQKPWSGHYTRSSPVRELPLLALILLVVLILLPYAKGEDR